MKTISLFITMLLSAFICHAQIGYQVALLERANGEPRANETVIVTVKITNSEGATVCSETKTETSNDFGILSMTVGSSSTFTDTDWSKLPFFIEATVDNVLIGKSQLLSVPVAEHAKHFGNLSKKLLKSKTWRYSYEGDTGEMSFTDTKVTLTMRYIGDDPHTEKFLFKYSINGNEVIFYDEELNGVNYVESYIYLGGKLYDRNSSHNQFK